VVQYYDSDGHHRYKTLGAGTLSKSRASELCSDFMRTINSRAPQDGETVKPPLLSEFISGVFLPFQRGKWKSSTIGTSEHRIKSHITNDLGNVAITKFTPRFLQAYLQQKFEAGLSYSMVQHLRFDLKAIFRLAVAEGVLSVNPTLSLYKPQGLDKPRGRAMTGAEVAIVIGAVEFREKVILGLAIFGGFRPGEILGLQRKHVANGASVIGIQQRVYRGELDDPKTDASTRTAAVPPRTAALLRHWLEMAVPSDPDAFVFAGETGRPLWRDTLLTDHIKPRLKPYRLDWVDFQVMRRTHATLSHEAGIDPKVQADQRGHGLGVAMDVYTRTTTEARAEAARQLEESVLVN
jgi:integrase